MTQRAVGSECLASCCKKMHCVPQCLFRLACCVLERFYVIVVSSDCIVVGPTWSNVLNGSLPLERPR